MTTVSCDMETTKFKRNLTTKDKSVLECLSEIEAEMKRIGFWNTNPPKFTVEKYLDAPSFELWLQCIFIPNATKAAKSGEYPENSMVGVMAMRQYDYHSYIGEAKNLRKLLDCFDKLVAD